MATPSRRSYVELLTVAPGWGLARHGLVHVWTAADAAAIGVTPTARTHITLPLAVKAWFSAAVQRHALARQALCETASTIRGGASHATAWFMSGRLRTPLPWALRPRRALISRSLWRCRRGTALPFNATRQAREHVQGQIRTHHNAPISYSARPIRHYGLLNLYIPSQHDGWVWSRARIQIARMFSLELCHEFRLDTAVPKRAHRRLLTHKSELSPDFLY